MTKPILPESITDEFILRTASQLNLTIQHNEQFEFLRNLSTIDVQAAPGCGKTTLTAAKLCMLAEGWHSITSGICVLSHTNTAKNEIIRILSTHTAGQRLLAYPHFIGTIQGFVDSFLALPHLREKGVEVRSLDDDIYERNAYSHTSRETCPNLYSLMKKRSDILKCIRTGEYRFYEGNMFVSPTPFGPGTNSSKELLSLKHRMTISGYIRYGDMYAFAQRHLYLHPQLKEALQLRFPLLIIDEAQDTNLSQDELLMSVFGNSDTVIQRIGDVNQAIFGENDEEVEASSFPSQDCLDLPQTMRFGAGIASLATKLTINREQTLRGNPDRLDTPLVLILFDQETITDVGERFVSEVVSSVSSEEIERFGVYALGSRKKSTAKEFPRDIGSYFPGWDSSPSRKRATSLFQVCRSTSPNDTNNLSNPTPESIWSAVVEILILGQLRLEGKRPNRSRLSRWATTQGLSKLIDLKQAMFELAFAPCASAEQWGVLVENLRVALPALEGDSAELQQYLSFPTAESSTEATEDQSFSACDYDTDPPVTLTINTIHGAKGETHAATLLLACPSNSLFDLKEVIPILLDKHDPKRITKTTIQRASNLIFVGMTRARNLVALAIPKDHSVGVLDYCKEAGWKTIDLTDAGSGN